MGDGVPAGSGSGGAGCGSDLGHAHRQRASRWISRRHHREWRTPPVSHSLTLNVFVVLTLITVALTRQSTPWLLDGVCFL